MTTRHRGWRARLAAATSVVAAGTGVLVFAPGADRSLSLPTFASAAPTSRPELPPAVPNRLIAEFGAVTAIGGHGRSRGHRALAADADAGQVQQPKDPAGGSAHGARSAVVPEGPGSRLILPAWRSLLESRWQQRLATVIDLSLAYHDNAERSDGGYHPGDQAETRELRRLMHEAVAARRALSDTEEALTRLSAGSYGRCEQCAAAIPAARLALEPEGRYCAGCIRQSTENPEPASNLPRSPTADSRPAR